MFWRDLLSSLSSWVASVPDYKSTTLCRPVQPRQPRLLEAAVEVVHHAATMATAVLVKQLLAAHARGLVVAVAAALVRRESR